jgi:two-component system, LytTR family, sensor histidine kinase AlgZ
MSSTRPAPDAVTEPRPAPLLPPEMLLLYLVVPLPAAYLRGHDAIGQPLSVWVKGAVSMYLPFIVYGGGFQLVYLYLMPHLLRGLTRTWQRVAVHALVISAGTFVIALGLAPLLEPDPLDSIQFLDFYLVSLIFSCACLIPGLAFQRQRVRARAAEHLALVERKAALEAQLQALQARTDPHFLFNSLNTVASLIQEDPVLAERTLERLADLFRYALESSRVRTVPLERELAMVADYLALQSARFGERLRTELRVEGDLGAIHVPPLLLQPLVENAIMHGTAQRRGGQIEVTARRERDQLILEVCDDGPGPGASRHTGAGTAVAGMIERLRLHYDGRGSLLMQPGARGGCVARLSLPIGGQA